MRALFSNAEQANLQNRKDAEEGLLVARHESLYTFGRRCDGRIIDLFWCREALSDFLKGNLEIRATNTAAEGGTVAEEQPLELVHDNERYESLGVVVILRLGTQIRKYRVLDAQGLLLDRAHAVRSVPSWPPSGAILRQGVVVDHGRRDAALVLSEMIYYVDPDGRPRANATPSLTKTGVAHNSSFDGMVTPGNQMAPEHFVHEVFFSLTLDVD
jgi:hypothetical protein